MEDDTGVLRVGGQSRQGWNPEGYSLPNDEMEQDRLDFIHAAYRLILDGDLTTLPFESSPKRVLDVGAGTGIWAMDFADIHQDSEVFGLDLTSTQPPPPPNCHWIVGDAESRGWWWAEGYDYIHMRSIGPCFRNFEAVVKNCFDALKPGASIEIQDGVWKAGCIDDSIDGTSIPEFFQAICEGAKKAGFDMLKTLRLKESLEAAGFTDVEERIINIPGSPWTTSAKMNRIGLYLGRSLQETKESYDRILGPKGGELKTRFMADLTRNDIHWYIPVYFVSGKKPYAPEGGPLC